MATTARDASRRGATPATRVLRLRGGRWSERADRLSGEEPLEVRVAGPGGRTVRVAVTMRTPGHDLELAVGLLVTEGIVAPGEVRTVAHCAEPGEPRRHNIVVVRCATDPAGRVAARIHAVSSSCGVCGRTSLDEVAVRCPPVAGDDVRVPAGALLGMPGTLRAAQGGFSRTGGLHAAGLLLPDGGPVCVREDIGRHNAVDKVVGWAALGGRLPLVSTVLLVSGRLSFEIVQKAAVAGIPVIAAVSAPSSLAVEAADRLGVTAVGFLREDRMNVYTHPHRVVR